MSIVEYEIPTSWTWTRIGEISHIEKEHIEPKETPNTTFNYLSIENVESETGNLVKFKPTKGKEIGSSKLKFTTKDILYSKLRPYLNKVHIPTFSGVSATDLIPIRSEGNISREYLAYYLRTQKIMEYLNSKIHGIQLPRVSVDDILETPIPLTPLGEQKRILSKIEELFRESKTAREALDRVPLILKKFRQSVLSSAFRGELVSPDPNDEPVEKLLEKIRKEKRKEWEKQLRSSGKNPEKIKYCEPEPVNTEGLPELPSGWIWVSLDMICSKVTDGTHFSPPNTRKGKIPYVTAKNIRPWGIDLSDITYVTKEIHNEIYSRCNPEKGDVLYIKDGVTTGLAAVNELDFEFSMLSSLALLKPLYSVLDSYYLKHYLNNQLTFKRLTDRMTGTAIKRIILDRIRKAEIALPSIEEQKKIVQKIEQLFAFADQIEKSIGEAKKRADRIDQAILTKAFHGELISQDPNDEPASVLLERIQSEREKQLEVKQKSKNKPRKSRQI